MPDKWETPTIKPLIRLGESTSPTTTSASSPKKYLPNLGDMEELLQIAENPTATEEPELPA